MNRIVPVVIAVFHNSITNKFLLTQRKEIDPDDREYGHCWNFPGGGLQFGETVEEGLSREIKEELGVDLEIEALIPKIFSPVRHKWQGVLISYLCKFKTDNPDIVLNHESLKYSWFTLEEIKSLKTLPLAFDIAREAAKLL